MTRYILLRIGQAAVTLVVLSVMIFSLARLTGDPTPLIMPAEATQADRDFFREQYGLDQSIPIQYLTFVSNVVHGDFGTSFRYREPAIEIVLRSLGPTMKLAGAAMALSLLIGVPLGILAAIKSGSWTDRLIEFYGNVGQATPSFWCGLMLILAFSIMVPIFPASGYGSVSHYVLPATTLAFFASAALARLTRANMREALKQDFIHFENVLGLPRRTILFKHALRNASIPIVTYLGLQFGLLLGGAVVTERVFAWPGIGQTIVSAVLSRDYPVIQATVLVTALMFILMNLLVDIVCMFLDPRIRP